MSRKKKRKKKNRSLQPRRKRMSRARRLQSAEHWLKSIRHARPAGRRLVRRYAKWYGVNRLCALIELELLGVPVDPVYAECVREEFARPRPKKKKHETTYGSLETATWDALDLGDSGSFTSGGGLAFRGTPTIASSTA